jgi:hypothetical protein
MSHSNGRGSRLNETQCHMATRGKRGNMNGQYQIWVDRVRTEERVILT